MTRSSFLSGLGSIRRRRSPSSRSQSARQRVALVADDLLTWSQCQLDIRWQPANGSPGSRPRTCRTACGPARCTRARTGSARVDTLPIDAGQAGGTLGVAATRHVEDVGRRNQAFHYTRAGREAVHLLALRVRSARVREERLHCAGAPAPSAFYDLSIRLPVHEEASRQRQNTTE